MKRIVLLLLYVMFFVLVPSCQKRSGMEIWRDWKNTEDWNQKGYYTYCGVEWGMTQEELIKHLDRKEGEYQVGEPVREAYSLSLEKKEPVLGVEAAGIRFDFRDLSMFKGEEETYGLVAVMILYTGVQEETFSQIRQNMAAVYGAPNQEMLEIKGSYLYEMIDVPKDSESDYWSGRNTMYQAMSSEGQEQYLTIMKAANEKNGMEMDDEDVKDLKDSMEIIPTTQIVFNSSYGTYINKNNEAFDLSSSMGVELPVVSLQFDGLMDAYARAVEESLESGK